MHKLNPLQICNRDYYYKSKFNVGPRSSIFVCVSKIIKNHEIISQNITDLVCVEHNKPNPYENNDIYLEDIARHGLVSYWITDYIGGHVDQSVKYMINHIICTNTKLPKYINNLIDSLTWL